MATGATKLGPMNLEFVPLLRMQRELYGMPRGVERFQNYLDTMLNDERDDVEFPPLVSMNPMGKDHLPEFVDRALAMDAETLGAKAAMEAAETLPEVEAEFKLGLVVVDDLMGAWTNRYTTEFKFLFEMAPQFKRGWLSGVLWTSESLTAERLEEDVRAVVYRAAYVKEHGDPLSLREMLAQESWVMAKAKCHRPTLEPEDLEYTREVIAPHLEASDRPTIIACLFGDPAARELGYPLQGLSERAGLALARHGGCAQS